MQNCRFLYAGFYCILIRSFEICTIIDFVSSLIPLFQMSTKYFQFNRVTSYPYQFGSDPTRLNETFLGSDQNGITSKVIPFGQRDPLKSSENQTKCVLCQWHLRRSNEEWTEMGICVRIADPNCFRSIESRVNARPIRYSLGTDPLACDLV